MVKRCIEQKLRLRNFDARHRRIESGAVVKSRKGIIGVEGGNGICYQWKEKGQCSQGDRYSFRPKIGRKNQNTLPPQLPSHPFTRSNCVEEEMYPRAKVTMGAILRKPCRYCLKGTCTRTSCEYWHSARVSILQEWNGLQKPAINGCSRIIKGWWTTKQKAKEMQTVPTEEEKATTRMLWLLWKMYLNWVVYHNIQMHWFLKVESLGKTRCRKSWNAIQRVRFTKSTLRRASIRDKKGPSPGKIQVKNPHQRSPYAAKFEDRSHEETEGQERCARSKAWNLAKNIFKLKEKDKAAFYSPTEEWVLPPLRQQRAGGKRVYGGFRS